MDLNTVFISSGITSAIYILGKSGIHFYKKYYLTSECHDQTLEITIVNHDLIPPPPPPPPPPVLPGNENA